MSQLAQTETRKNPLTRWSAPSLDDKLTALVDGFRSLSTAPVIGPKTADALRQFLAQGADPAMPARSDVEAMLGLLATVKRRRQASDAETSAQIEQYWQGLRDVPLDDLRHAYDALLKGSPWFPDISEIRQASTGGPVSRYRVRCVAMRALLTKHENDWSPPVEPISAEQAADIKRMIADIGGGDDNAG